VAVAVYTVCVVTSVLCAGLLLRSYRESSTRLLLWASVCFVGLALNSLGLFVDKVVAPDVDLSVWRSLPALAGLSAFVYGLISEKA
jgi:hypothetical protein